MFQIMQELIEGSLEHWALKIASSGEDCPPVAQDVEVSTDENTSIDITSNWSFVNWW